MRALRDFLRPIEDSKLLPLRDHLARAAKAFCAIGLCLTPINVLLDVLVRRARPLPVVLLGGAVMVASTVNYLLARRGRVHPERLLFAQVTIVLVITTLAATPELGNSSEMMAFMGLAALIIGTFVPWRPSLSLYLVIPSVGQVLVAHWLLHVSLPIHPWTLVFISCTAGVISAAGVQVQRGLWLRLDRARAQLVATERMSVLGRMTAGIAHELKTPLAAALNGLERSRRLTAELRESIGHADVTADDLREIVGEIDATVALQTTSLARASRFIHALRGQTLSSHTAVCVAFRLGESVETVQALLGHQIRTGRAALDVSRVGPTTKLTGDPTKLEQILTNLIGNALSVCDEAGCGSKVVVSSEERPGGVLVVVEDNGPGVPVALREKIFDALFTTRGSREGTGLGLFIARDLAESTFGGTLRLMPSDAGARFELWCPTRGARAVAGDAWAPFIAVAAAR